MSEKNINEKIKRFVAFVSRRSLFVCGEFLPQFIRVKADFKWIHIHTLIIIRSRYNRRSRAQCLWNNIVKRAVKCRRAVLVVFTLFFVPFLPSKARWWTRNAYYLLYPFLVIFPFLFRPCICNTHRIFYYITFGLFIHFACIDSITLRQLRSISRLSANLTSWRHKTKHFNTEFTTK